MAPLGHRGKKDAKDLNYLAAAFEGTGAPLDRPGLPRVTHTAAIVRPAEHVSC